MKNLLLLLTVFLLMQGCGSVRKFTRTGTLAGQVPELVASADTLPAHVNAAQTSGNQLFAGMPAASKPPTAKPVTRHQLRAVHRQLVTLRDSTELYERRKPVDLRVTNRTGLASFWLAMGSLGSFIIGSVTDYSSVNNTGGQSTASGVFGLLGFLAGIAAFVTGLVSLSEFRRNPDKYKGKGYPIAGITWGGLLLLVTLLIIAVVLIFIATI